MDRDLVEQAQQGDREAFGVLARTRADRLFAIGQRILRDVDLAEDAMQQALVIAWRELPRLRDPDRFDAWLQRMLVHACYLEARNMRAWMGSRSPALRARSIRSLITLWRSMIGSQVWADAALAPRERAAVAANKRLVVLITDSSS